MTRTRSRRGIDRATWAALNTDKLRPLQNRAIQGRYSPGSTFKIAVATAALEEGVATPDFRVHCGGGADFYGRYFKCHLKGGHGTVDMRHALERSCNVYFYTLGNMLGVDRMHKWATRLGLGVSPASTCRTKWRASCRRPRGSGSADGRKVVCRRDDLGGHRTGTGLRDAALACRDDGDGGQRRHEVPPAHDQGVRGRQAWNEAPPPALEQFTLKPSTCRRCTTGCGWSSTRRAPADAAGSPGATSSGKTGTAQVISLTGGKAARNRKRICATTAGSSSSLRRTTP